MRHAMGALPFLLAIGSLPIMADTLPVYCGGAGAKSYTPPAVTIAAVVLDRGTVITVTNATVAINGDISSVKALAANPGPDGISIQEAIMATNNDPGTWVIQFAPALKGSTIDVDPGGQGGGLTPLTGGNVTINGDIDGDGKPDITFTSLSGTGAGFLIVSGGNTLYGLALQHFSWGVFIQRPSAAIGLLPATGTTFSNITIGNLAITDIQDKGIWLCPTCGGTDAQSSAPPEVTRNTWDHLLITGNTITGNDSGPLQGIGLGTGNVGDTLQHTTIANNTMVGAGGISIGVGGEVGSTGDRALDTLIANNAISSSGRGIGIGLGGNSSNLGYFKYIGNPAGGDGGSGSLIDGMQIIANRIHITGTAQSGIGLTLADTPSDGFQLPVLQYAENNIARNIGIIANTIEGAGITLYAGSGTVRNDMIANLSILGNTVTGVTKGGIALGGASSFGSPAPSTGNTLSNVLVQANTIRSSVLPLDPISSGYYTFEQAIQSAGIGVQTGWRAPGNSLNGISIANNDVDTPSIGIAITAGSGAGTPYSGPSFPADNNVVSAAQIFCNQVDQAPTLGVTPSSGIRGINVTAGVDDAHGNQVQQLLVTDNLVGGLPGGASLLPYLGSSGSGNTITMSQASAPWPQFMPGNLVSAATFQQGALAAGTLVSLFGLNLNGATVQFDGVSAPILYSSASQVNLQVPWEVRGKASTSVTVTANSVTSAPQAISVGAADPGIFSLGAPQGGQGAIVSPAGIVVDANSPAHAGDYVEIYCTGLGAVSNTPETGAVASASPSSNLIGNPTVTIGGVPAAVSFAGLAPGYIGLYQVNVQVPQGVAAGDAVPVMLSAGAIASNTVTISVR